MKFIIKVFRILFFYCLFFIVAVIFTETVMAEWSDGWKALLSLVAPGFIVWGQERNRTQRQAKKVKDAASEEKALPPSNTEGEAVMDNKPPWEKQNYRELVEVSRRAGPELAGIAERREADKEKTRKVKGSWRLRPKDGWVPSIESVSVAGRDIGGLIYVGTPPRLNNYGYRDKCRAYIDPALSVARVGSDKAGDHMPYWPGYSDIPAQCRATYLDWLASGRKDASYNPGYMFLYFYGLERRFFVDQSKADAEDIVAEVKRLKALYADNYSIQRYLGEFLDIAALTATEFDSIAPCNERDGWDIPFSIKYAIGARLNRGEKLSSEWVFSWWICHPEVRLRTAARRCAREFRDLFKIRFDGRFPDGLKVTKPRKALAGTYQAASQEFSATLKPSDDGKPIPDISGLRKPIEIAQEIADEVMDDLDKLSRYLGRNPDGADSLEAAALVPLELLDLRPSKELEQLKAWATDVINSDGLVPVSEVVARLEGAQSDKLTKRQLTGAADALARIGVGFAPDPRFALRSPKIGEPIKLFDLGEPVARLEEVSDAFRTALLEAALGAFVAHADGQITSSERSALLANAQQAPGLHALETTRLLANLDWMLAVAPDLSLLRRKLKDTGTDAQAAIRAALVSAAHADGIVQSEEVAGIEKIYKVLGLDPNLVYSDLHAGDVSDGPVQVRQAEPSAPGEAIPQADAPNAFRLDTSKIASTQKETAQVSSLLGSIFDETDEEADDGNISAAILPGLDAAHVAFVREIITREHWDGETFTALCARHGLMASGAIEDVNEWAFEVYDDAILEEYDGYEVNPEIAAELKTLFEKEGKDVQIETA